MYFLLLQGMHSELGKTFRAETEPDKEGRLRIKNRPVVKSKRDLVAAFGVEKFRPISESEAKALLKTDGLLEKPPDSTDSDPAASEAESDAVKAAKQGAAAIAEPPGTDVTHKFPETQDETDITPLKIYFKRGEGYFVVDNGKIITEVALKRADVVDWVQAYREG